MSVSPADSPRQYPVACPSCAELKGFPIQVRTLKEQPSAVEVKLKCRDCGHEWLEIIASSD
jgi:ribosomal protein S27E